MSPHLLQQAGLRTNHQISVNSSEGLIVSTLSLRPSREQRVLLAACTTSRPAPATHLSRRRDRDRPVGFADVAMLPDPEWAASAPGRFTVAGLVPAGQLAVVPLPAEPGPATAPRPLPSRDLIERCAAVSTALHADDERHLDTMRVLGEISAALAAATDKHALRMALAPVEAMLNAQVA